MVAGVDQTGPMDKESRRSITSSPEEALPDPAMTRWIVLVVLTTALVLDLAGVLPVPIEDLLAPLLTVL